VAGLRRLLIAAPDLPTSYRIADSHGTGAVLQRYKYNTVGSVLDANVHGTISAH
jgi:hypothetical protein